LGIQIASQPRLPYCSNSASRRSSLSSKHYPIESWTHPPRKSWKGSARQPWRRWRAIRENPEIGAAAAKPLLSALNNEHPSLRSAASDGLAAIGEPAVPLLLDRTKENHTLTVADTIFYANRVVYAPPGSAAGKLVDGGLCTDEGGWKGKFVPPMRARS
jgi:hypothetical protein